MKEYDTKTIITRLDVDWMHIKSACMTTISKQAGTKEPSTLWKKKLLICRHSPIRRGVISWKWPNIPYAISTHFARHHIGCEKFIGTERTDRTHVDRETRSQMNYVPMEMDANLDALINISSRRLCTSADPTTRKYWEALITEIAKVEPVVAWSNVPQCVMCGGCKEPFGPCPFYDNLMKDAPSEVQTNLIKRYDYYNKKVRNLVVPDEN